MTLCNTANFILGSLNRNTQQSDDGERKPKKRKQQEADSSDDANIKRLVLVLLAHTK